MTSGLERDVMYKPGATFYKEGDALMFRYQADSSSVIGPRVATEADKKAHAGELEIYLKNAFHGAPLEAFDHDNNGEPGGNWRADTEPEVTIVPAQPARPVSDEHKHVPADYESIPTPKKRGRPPKV